MSSTPCDCIADFGRRIVKKVIGREEDSVNKGDFLLEYDNEDLKYQVEEQKIKLEAAKYNCERVKMHKESDDDLIEAQLMKSIEENKLRAL